MKPLQIGQVSRRTGLSVDTIRFYEKSGLLSEPSRSGGGYRLFQEKEIADLEFIRRAQKLGFTLGEIRQLLNIHRQPVRACEHVQSIIDHKLTEVHAKIEELTALEAALSEALKRCRSMPPGDTNGCCPGLRYIDERARNGISPPT